MMCNTEQDEFILRRARKHFKAYQNSMLWWKQALEDGDNGRLHAYNAGFWYRYCLINQMKYGINFSDF